VSTRRVNRKIADSTRNQRVFFQGILPPTNLFVVLYCSSGPTPGSSHAWLLSSLSFPPTSASSSGLTLTPNPFFNPNPQLCLLRSFNIFMDAGYACLPGTSASLYFGSFYVVVIFVVMNLLTSFILGNNTKNFVFYIRRTKLFTSVILDRSS